MSRPIDESLKPWFKHPRADGIPKRLAQVVHEYETGASVFSPLATLAAAAVVESGHVCADLTRCPFEPPHPPWPALATWIEDLGRSKVVGSSHNHSPVVLDLGRLYLARYHAFETQVAADLKSRAAKTQRLPDCTRSVLDELMPPLANGPDLQRLAVATALSRGLAVISGGPGTGKTTTMVRLVAALGRIGVQPDLIRLAAPTGKAAQRLGSQMAAGLQSLPIDSDLAKALPHEAVTLQRLLGASASGGRYRHNRDNPIEAKVVIVDEVSMVDLPLLARLIDALHPDARLILVGDADQLVSVEAGSIFADILAAVEANTPDTITAALLPDADAAALPRKPEKAPPLSGSVVRLTKTHRFKADSAIAAACRATLAGDLDELMRLLSSGADNSVRLSQMPPESQLAARLKEHQTVRALRQLGQADSPQAALKALAAGRVLTALREGTNGSQSLNQLLATQIDRTGRPNLAVRGTPILVTRNASQLNLANGHVGVVWPDERGAPLVYFESGEGPGWPLPIGRLPPHQPAWAMTIHKSQGSEYDRVLIILGDKPNRLHTRELLYTAISRAREGADIWASEDVLRACLDNRTARASGLRERLAIA
jgi:exodeoxyribonuclease V alpha subunit